MERQIIIKDVDILDHFLRMYEWGRGFDKAAACDKLREVLACYKGADEVFSALGYSEYDLEKLDIPDFYRLIEKVRLVMIGDTIK